MENIKLDYKDDSITLLTAFEEIARLDTSSVEGYMILACDKGKLDADVNGSKQHLEAFDALIFAAISGCRPMISEKRRKTEKKSVTLCLEAG